VNKAPDQFTLLPLNQYYPVPLQAPYFYQDRNHTYFVRSRKVYESTIEQVKRPNSVVLSTNSGKWLEFKEFDLRRDLGRPFHDRLLQVMNPWILAEEEIAPQKLEEFSARSGIRF